MSPVLPPSAAALILCLSLVVVGSPAMALEKTPQSPSAAQPNLPDATPQTGRKPGSPVVEEIVKSKQPGLDVRKRGATKIPRRRHVSHRYLRRGYGRNLDLPRPALAGVMLVEPLPPPPEPPHFTVPTPVYPLDSVAAALLTPPPPIVCRPTRRDPSQPDSHLYKEAPVVCEPDNP